MQTLSNYYYTSQLLFYILCISELKFGELKLFNYIFTDNGISYKLYNLVGVYNLVSRSLNIAGILSGHDYSYILFVINFSVGSSILRIIFPEGSHSIII